MLRFLRSSSRWRQVHARKVRFSATLSEEPEVQVALA